MLELPATSESTRIEEPPASPSEPQKDFPPEDGDFGMIIHPPNFTPPDAGATNHASWPTTDAVSIDNRMYTIIVDRTNANEQDRQVWLPGSGGHRGYEGRWGLRVSGDPFGRRAGLRFPEFVEMFLVGLVKFLSK
jgi:hypothetical protein